MKSAKRVFGIVEGQPTFTGVSGLLGSSSVFFSSGSIPRQQPMIMVLESIAGINAAHIARSDSHVSGSIVHRDQLGASFKFMRDVAFHSLCISNECITSGRLDIRNADA
ncbi:MAG TPA: hypothetical protein VL492_09640 [Methylovirgula sp.]|jgi:hypothetical protein|nr:hypothetical protein [Methylovirgula sp.]